MGELRTVLLVEDDEELAELMREYLSEHGLEVHVVSDGAKAVERVRTLQPDVVVLDQMLPGRDGLEICRELRPQFDGPILFLTARSGWVDEVVGLEVGADDYLGKPVQPRLLLARIRTVLRRMTDRAASTRPSEPPELTLDPARRQASLGERTLTLTDAEFDLLAFLVAHAGRPLRREELSEAVLGTAYDPADRTIDVRVARLRAKLGDDPREPRFIRSIRGVGYLFLPGPGT